MDSNFFAFAKRKALAPGVKDGGWMLTDIVFDNILSPLKVNYLIKGNVAEGSGGQRLVFRVPSFGFRARKNINAPRTEAGVPNTAPWPAMRCEIGGSFWGNLRFLGVFGAFWGQLALRKWLISRLSALKRG